MRVSNIPKVVKMCSITNTAHLRLLLVACEPSADLVVVVVCVVMFTYYQFGRFAILCTYRL